MTVVFLDRDGVINENRDDYVRSVDEFVFLPGALESLARLKEAGIAVVIVSNQAGVGRGLLDPAELDRINRKMCRMIADHGGEISGSYYCIHRKDEGCECRKPEIGLFRKACDEIGLSMEGSFLIGDGESDIEAGHKAGCRTILVLTGRSSADEVESWRWKPDRIASDLPAAVDYILARSRSRG